MQAIQNAAGNVADVVQAGAEQAATTVGAVSGLPTTPPFGFSNQPGPDGKCFCCPQETEGCCTAHHPIFYCSVERSWTAPRVVQQENCSQTGWVINNAPLFGSNINMSYEAPCCPCGDTMLNVSDGGRPVGSIRAPACPVGCGDTVTSEALDAAGRSRFTRRRHCCGYADLYFQDFACCGMTEVGYPVYGPEGTPFVPVGMIDYRYHGCCLPFYPQWWGFRQWPTGTQSRDDQILLIAMVHNFEHEMRQARRQRNRGGAAVGAMS